MLENMFAFDYKGLGVESQTWSNILIPFVDDLV